MSVHLRFICLITLAIGLTAQKAHHHPKTQKSHEHGSAQIDIAVEGKTADIELHVPAMGIVGFEYVPTTAADKKKQADALTALKTNVAKIAIFDSAAKCTISTKKVEVEQEEPDHAEIDGDFQAACAQSLEGTKIGFGLTKVYPSLTTVKVQVVAAGGSIGAEVKNDQGSVTVPR